MYRVLTTFRDLQDNNYRYHAGDEFPRKGLVVSEERLNELLTDKNRRGIPVIASIIEIKAEPVKKVEKVEKTEVEEVKSEESAPKPRRGRKKNVE